MFRFLASLFLFCFLAPSAFALSSDWMSDEAVSVRVISGVEGVGEAESVPLGLDIQLAEGWHTYWRSPGMAGLPPQLDWSQSQNDASNLKSATLGYPAPRRYTAYGLETIGYRDHVVFPLEAHLIQAGKALKATGTLDLLVCSSLCVPKHFDLSLTIPAGEARPSPEADLLAQAQESLPKDSSAAGLSIKKMRLDGKNLIFWIRAQDALTAPDLFVEGPEGVSFGPPVIDLTPSGQEAQLTVPLVDQPKDMALTGQNLTVTLVDGTRAAELHITVPSGEGSPQIPFWLALVFALLGGVILNLMPCVLPVLSLKILSIITHGGGEGIRVRHSFLTTAAGIIFSFLVLAGVAAGLKEAGVAAGWGVQFQQPIFLIFLIVILTFFAANLWGFFDIPLPRFLADRMDPAYHPKLAGDFATGALATLLATPCSAPFLGTAISVALAGCVAQIFGIFLALGIGMALPYLAVAAFPRLATCLPKPGKWMLTLRRFLGLALAGTAVWLLWVLAAQITAFQATLFGLLMLAVILFLGFRKHGVGSSLVLTLLIEMFVIVGIGSFGGLTPAALRDADFLWVPYSAQTLAKAQAEGKTVFLDVTADWCLTCKANMKFTLSDPELVDRLFHQNVIAMQADWTNPDPEITKLLQSHGRYGIPFNAAFGPAAPQGIVLPELLTVTEVREALDAAEGKKQE